MGFSISWLAVKKAPAALLPQLGLSPTGEAGDVADYPLVGRSLPRDWYLLVADPL